MQLQNRNIKPTSLFSAQNVSFCFSEQRNCFCAINVHTGITAWLHLRWVCLCYPRALIHRWIYGLSGGTKQDEKLSLFDHGLDSDLPSTA